MTRVGLFCTDLSYGSRFSLTMDRIAGCLKVDCQNELGRWGSKDEATMELPLKEQRNDRQNYRPSERNAATRE